MKPRIIFFALGLVLALYNLPLAWGQADATKRLIDGAKKEGKVVWYRPCRFKTPKSSPNDSSRLILLSKPKRFDL